MEKNTGPLKHLPELLLCTHNTAVISQCYISTDPWTVDVFVASYNWMFQIIWSRKTVWHFPDAFGSYYFKKASLTQYPGWLGLLSFRCWCGSLSSAVDMSCCTTVWSSLACGAISIKHACIILNCSSKPSCCYFSYWDLCRAKSAAITTIQSI